MALEEAASDSFWAREENDMKHGGTETLAMNQLKVKSVRRIIYETKKKALLNIKEPGLTGFNICIPFIASPPVQLSHDAKKTEMASWQRSNLGIIKENMV